MDVSRKKEKKARVWSETELKFLAIVLADEKTDFAVKLDTLALKKSANNEVFEQVKQAFEQSLSSEEFIKEFFFVFFFRFFDKPRRFVSLCV